MQITTTDTLLNLLFNCGEKISSCFNKVFLTLRARQNLEKDNVLVANLIVVPMGLFGWITKITSPMQE